MTDPRTTQMFVRSLAVTGNHLRAVAYDPNARSYEAFILGSDDTDRTTLLEPLKATSLKDALAETTARWSWDRGQRLGVREIGGGKDKLHVYAVRKKSVGHTVWRDYVPSTEHQRWLDHICTIDLNVIAGIPIGLVGSERDIHAHRQRRRPAGATMEREHD